MRLLVVDDNRAAADGMAQWLRLFAHEVRVEYDGTRGLAAAREWRPECVLSDIRMPGLDGYALARAVRADPTIAGTKLVALSAYSGADHERQAADAGFDHRLTKGGDPAALLEVLKMIEQVKELADRTRELAEKNVELAGQTKQLLEEVKEDVAEVKKEVKELKEDVRELKDMTDASDS
jgi:two-component system, OmpR family, response regulator